MSNFHTSRLDMMFCTACEYSIHNDRCKCAAGPTYPGDTGIKHDQDKIKGVRAVHLQADGYDKLAEVLGRAFDQSARGKGKERHSKGEDFPNQPIVEGARRFGTGAMLFQAFKKSEESQRLPKDRAVTELLGAIVYLAAAVIVLEETSGQEKA